MKTGDPRRSSAKTKPEDQTSSAKQLLHVLTISGCCSFEPSRAVIVAGSSVMLSSCRHEATGEE